MGSDVSKLQTQLFEQALTGHKDFFQTLKLLSKEAERTEDRLIELLQNENDPVLLHQKDNLLHTACRFAPRNCFHQEQAEKGQTFANKVKIIKYLVDKRILDINTPSASSGLRPIDYACHLCGQIELDAVSRSTKNNRNIERSLFFAQKTTDYLGMNWIFDEQKKHYVPMPPDIILFLILEGADFNHSPSNSVDPSSLISLEKPVRHPFFQDESYRTITETEVTVAKVGPTARHKKREETHTVLKDPAGCPIFIACRSCFISGIIELAGRGANAKVCDKNRSTPLTELLTNWYQFNEQGLTQALEALLPILPKYFFSKRLCNLRYITTPIEHAITCRPSSTTHEQQVELLAFLAANNFNFYNEVGSILWSMNPATSILVSPKQFSRGTTPGERLKEFFELSQRSQVPSAASAPAMRELFLKPPDECVGAPSRKTSGNLNDLLHTTLRSPFQYSWQWEHESWEWDGKLIDKSESSASVIDVNLQIYQEIGRSSPVAASILLMRFDLFKVIIKQCGFGSLLKPIRLRPSDDNLPCNNSPCNNTDLDYRNVSEEDASEVREKYLRCALDFAEAKRRHNEGLHAFFQKSADVDRKSLPLLLSEAAYRRFTNRLATKLFCFSLNDFAETASTLNFASSLLAPEDVIEMLNVYPRISSIMINPACSSLESFRAIAHYKQQGRTRNDEFCNKKEGEQQQQEQQQQSFDEQEEDKLLGGGIERLRIDDPEVQQGENPYRINLAPFTREYFQILMDSKIVTSSLLVLHTPHFDFFFEPFDNEQDNTSNDNNSSRPRVVTFLERFLEAFRRKEDLPSSSRCQFKMTVRQLGQDEFKRKALWEDFMNGNMQKSNPKLENVEVEFEESTRR